MDLIWEPLYGVSINTTTHSKSLLQSLQLGLFHVSSCYEGRASDIFIVRNSGFLNLIEPYDEVMADRGFKIREDLMIHMATLCIPPSWASSIQLLPRDVRETSNIANVRIYVEQAIGWLTVFLLLKNELPISLLPLADDIYVTCYHHCVFNTVWY